MGSRKRRKRRHERRSHGEEIFELNALNDDSILIGGDGGGRGLKNGTSKGLEIDFSKVFASLS